MKGFCLLLISICFLNFNLLTEKALANGNETFAISYAYLQYRNYDPDFGTPRIKGWIEFHLNGQPLQADRIQEIELFDDDYNKVPIEGSYYWYSTGYYNGNWNNGSQTIDYSGPYTEGGYSVRFPAGAYLSAGNYTYVAKTDQGQIINYTIYFPGMHVLPYISSQSIDYQWNSNGTFTLNWDRPNGQFDEYRIVFYHEYTGQELLYIKLPEDKNSITLSAEILQNIILESDSEFVVISLQTRSYSQGMNYARAVTYADIPVEYINETPLVPTLITPDYSTSAPVTYTWNRSEGATWYQLWVEDDTKTVFKKWYAETSITSGSICSVIPVLTYESGNYSWWVRAYNDSGYSPWSSGMDFSIGSNVNGLPSPATLVSPSGSTSDTITFSWNAVSNSTWYQLWVNDSTGVPVKKQWYHAQTAGCGSGQGSCSISLEPGSFDSKEYKWWIQTYNDSGYGNWSSPLNFRVEEQGQTPAAANLLSLTANASDSNFTYVWSAVENASWYYLWVDDENGNQIKQWYTAEQTGCETGTGTCSITPQGTAEMSGSCQWWIQTYNEFGSGQWSSGSSFSADEETDNFLGQYYGSYSGGYSGTWNVTVDALGNVSGTGSNSSIQGYIFSIAGNVTSSGQIEFSSTSGSTNERTSFSGSIDDQGNVTGQWSRHDAQGVFRGELY